MIPGGRIDPISQAYMNLYPDANQRRAASSFSRLSRTAIDQGDGRVDYTPSQHDQFFLAIPRAGGQTFALLH